MKTILIRFYVSVQVACENLKGKWQLGSSRHGWE